MPRSKTNFYHFSGLVTQDIYSEGEMAAAVGLTVPQLRAALDPELYGPSPYPERAIFSYHAHPAATGGQFEFNRSAYRHNLIKSNFVRWMKDSGLWTIGEACAAFLRKFDDEALVAMTDDDFRSQLAGFVAAWARRDYTYDERIKDHFAAEARRMRIWIASGYLRGLAFKFDHVGWQRGIRFVGVDEPPAGTFIPWMYLTISRTLGFFDQREFPDQKSDFIRQPAPEEWRPYQGVVKVGDLIAGRRWVYDDWREFMGMVVSVAEPEIEFTEQGWYTMEVDRNDIEVYYPRKTS